MLTISEAVSTPPMLSKKPARPGRTRLLWSCVASVLLNTVVWVTSCAHFASLNHLAEKTPREQIEITAKIRIEHRPAPNLQSRIPPPAATSFLPQPAALTLPTRWAKEAFGNIAETNTTLWLDWSNQTASFVPRVFLWQKKLDMRYMYRPSLRDSVADVTQSLRAEDAHITTSAPQTVCHGTRAGWFLAYEKPNDDPPLRIEETLYLIGGTIFRATYIRPIDQPEDPQTRAALNTLCK